VAVRGRRDKARPQLKEMGGLAGDWDKKEMKVLSSAGEEILPGGDAHPMLGSSQILS